MHKTHSIAKVVLWQRSLIVSNMSCKVILCLFHAEYWDKKDSEDSVDTE